jgi:hypothetical protein
MINQTFPNVATVAVLLSPMVPPRRLRAGQWESTIFFRTLGSLRVSLSYESAHF